MVSAVSGGRILVTGASRGIGRATALALFERGARLALCARDADALVEVASVAPDRAVVVVADLGDRVAAAAAVDRAAAALGGLDGLVCCAGVVRRARLEAVRDEDLDRQIAVNLVAPLVMARRFAALPADASRAIVNVASTLGIKPVADAIVYALTKAALISLTQSLALDLAPAQIRVNAVAPGIVDTEMIAGRPREELARLHPLQRLGTPADVAEAIVHLLDARFSTGTVLAVDGGLLCT